MPNRGGPSPSGRRPGLHPRSVPGASVRARLLAAWGSGEALSLPGETIPAALLRDVLLQRLPGQGPADPRGFALGGATVVGHLDLKHVQFAGSLSLVDCALPDGLTLEGATVGGALNLGASRLAYVNLQQAHIKGRLWLYKAVLTEAPRPGYSLHAENARIDGGVYLDHLVCVGAVCLKGAQITGLLVMQGATLHGQVSGYGLNAEDLALEGAAHLRDGMATASAITLSGAHITGQLIFSGASLGSVKSGGRSLNAQNIEVGSNAALDEGFTTTGTVQLTEARIGGQLVMGGARLGGAPDDYSLHAQGVRIGGGAFLVQGFTTTGAVMFSGARITGQLVMIGATLNGTKEDASFYGGDLHVEGSTFMAGDFRATGRISFNGAQLQLLHVRPISPPGEDDQTLAYLDLDHATIRELRLNLPDTGLRTVRPAQDGPAWSSLRGWVSLDHCTYANRPQGGQEEVQRWVQLLRFHPPTYQARAYQQLATVHRAAGHDRDAATILIAQQSHRRAEVLRVEGKGQYRRRAALFWHRAGLEVSRLVLGYGHRPARAAAALLVLILAAWTIACLATHTWDGNSGERVARRPATAGPGGTLYPAAACSTGETAGLALRMAVPLVNNLGQGTCAINTSSTTGGAYAIASFVLQVAAWVLGALVVAAAARAWRRPA